MQGGSSEWLQRGSMPMRFAMLQFRRADHGNPRAIRWGIQVVQFLWPRGRGLARVSPATWGHERRLVVWHPSHSQVTPILAGPTRLSTELLLPLAPPSPFITPAAWHGHAGPWSPRRKQHPISELNKPHRPHSLGTAIDRRNHFVSQASNSNVDRSATVIWAGG